jgi:hypothetical protein
MSHRSARSIRLASLIALVPLGTLPAQVVPVKTVPIAEGDQFTFLPSTNAGMVDSLAVLDSVHYPFRNPAATARLRHGFFFGAPTLYSMNHQAGQGSTLSLGAIAKGGRSFGGLALAVQELGSNRDDNVVAPDVLRVDASGQVVSGPRNGNKTNRYALAMVGRSIRPTLSIGASASLSHLGDVDGTEMLYAGSQGLQQSGHLADVRLGILQQWTRDRSLELVALRDQSTMTHDITFFDGTWDPSTRTTKFTQRIEHNADASATWGTQLQYRQPIADTAWHAAGLLSANRTSYSKAPTMGSMDVTRAPLNSSAFNAGVGLSRAWERTTGGFDAIYEPIFGHTSQTGKPNDDRYRFNNAVLRAGVSHRIPMKTPGAEIRFGGGMQLRDVHYGLDQADSTGATQHTTAHWNEWIHSGSMSVISPTWEMHWLLQVRSGTGRPSASTFSGFPGGPTAPSGLIPVRTLTQQFTVTVPIR